MPNVKKPCFTFIMIKCDQYHKIQPLLGFFFSFYSNLIPKIKDFWKQFITFMLNRKLVGAAIEPCFRFFVTILKTKLKKNV